MVSPTVSVRTETDSQEKATGRRVWDVGESESRVVMMRTAVRTLPQPERAQTSDRWRVTGKIAKSFAAGSTDRHRAFVPTGDGAADGKP